MMKEILFRNVRDFGIFLEDLASILNMDKVKEKLNLNGVKLYFESQRLETIGTEDGKITGGGISQTWFILDKNQKKIGEIEAILLTPMFFILSDGWKLIDTSLVEKLLVPDDDSKKNKKAVKLIEEEKEKLKNLIEKGEGDKVDHNLALFVKKWYVPIEPVKIKLTDESNTKLEKFLEKLAASYSNDYPMEGLDKIVPKLKMLNIEITEFKIPIDVDWSKID